MYSYFYVCIIRALNCVTVSLSCTCMYFEWMFCFCDYCTFECCSYYSEYVPKGYTSFVIFIRYPVKFHPSEVSILVIFCFVFFFIHEELGGAFTFTSLPSVL